MYKNVASQKIAVYAYDPTTTAGSDPSKTGDASNITAEISIDGGASAAVGDTNPTELDSTDHPGIYLFDLTQAETNGDLLIVSAVSSTSNILLDPVQVFTTPGDSTALDVNVVELSGDSTAADNLESDYDGTGYNKSASTIGTCTTNTDMRGTDSALLASTTGSTLTSIPWNSSWDTEVQSECNDALVALGLDHLVSTSVTGTDIANNSIIARMVSSSATADWDDFVNTTDSLQAIRDRGDSAWITATGFSTLTTADVNTEVDTALSDIHLDHLLAVDYDPSSKPGVATALLNELIENDGGVSRFTANSLEQGPISDATAANQTTITTHLTDIKGAGWSSSTDTLEEIRDRGDSAWTTATGFSTHTAANVRSEMDSNSTQLAAIVADTNELQGDWTNGGRLDLIVDAILVDTDTTIPAQITGLNDISTADVNAEVDTALADIHLDHLLAVDYDPASKPGTATALLNELIENNGGVSRYTAAALAQAPSGSGGDATAANQTTIINHLTDVKGATWSSTDTLENIYDDTNELQTDWVNGGRLDTILDDRASQSSVDTIDSNVDAILVDTDTTLPATLAVIQKLLQASKYIDTSNSSQWQLVYIERDTGDLSTGTELLRQDLKESDGTAITTTSQYIAITEDTA
jgi:hypothetical protein